MTSVVPEFLLLLLLLNLQPLGICLQLGGGEPKPAAADDLTLGAAG